MKLLTTITCLFATGSIDAFGYAPMGTRARTVSKMVATDDYYMDEQRRSTMNLILLGSATVTLGGMAVPFFAFFYPPGVGDGSGGSTTAKEANAVGKDLFATAYLASHIANDRSLSQGLKGDPT